MRASDYTYISRATGRREPPAVCRTCGELVPDTPRFGNEATCDRDACRWAALERTPVSPWLAEKETR